MSGSSGLARCMPIGNVYLDTHMFIQVDLSQPREFLTFVNCHMCLNYVFKTCYDIRYKTKTTQELIVSNYTFYICLYEQITGQRRHLRNVLVDMLLFLSRSHCEVRLAFQK